MIETTTDLWAEAETEDSAYTACFLVRIGTMSGIGRFRIGVVGRIQRGSRVVCRSQRGLEVGHVLHPVTLPARNGHDLSDGWILRQMTPEDELLWGHLEHLSREARDKCCQWLIDQRIDATLIEVEPLLDGKTLYFHFLASVEAIVQQHLDSLVKVYQRSVAKSQFAQLLEHGCGPGCGTELAKNGCGTKGGCAICQIVGACASKNERNNSGQ